MSDDKVRVFPHESADVGWQGPPDYAERLATMCDVLEEMKRQDGKWGEQNHPLTSALQTPGFGEAHTRESAKGRAEFWQRENQRREEAGELAWDGILLEEVYEALAEEEGGEAKGEFTQVAAVAMAIVQCIYRRNRRAQGAAEAPAASSGLGH